MRHTSRLALAIVVFGAGLAGLTLLLDAIPAWVTARVHPSLSGVPLGLAAAAVVLSRFGSGTRRADIVRCSVLACGFLAWSADQVVPWSGAATVCNDLAILLFVSDVALGLAPAAVRS